jgi:hypothetical protein
MVRREVRLTLRPSADAAHFCSPRTDRPRLRLARAGELSDSGREQATAQARLLKRAEPKQRRRTPREQGGNPGRVARSSRASTPYLSGINTFRPRPSPIQRRPRRKFEVARNRQITADSKARAAEVRTAMVRGLHNTARTRRARRLVESRERPRRLHNGVLRALSPRALSTR